MAAQWALDAADEAGYTDDNDIDAQLDILAEAGANFDHASAMATAAILRNQAKPE